MFQNCFSNVERFGKGKRFGRKELVIKARQEKLRYNNLLLDTVFSYYQSVVSGPKVKRREKKEKTGATTLASICNRIRSL